MDATAVLESVVVHNVQTSPLAGPAENRNIGANDKNAASSSPSQTIEQVDRLRHRSNQVPETGIHHQDEEETINNNQDILTPTSDGIDGYKGEALDERSRNMREISSSLTGANRLSHSFHRQNSLAQTD